MLAAGKALEVGSWTPCLCGYSHCVSCFAKQSMSKSTGWRCKRILLTPCRDLWSPAETSKGKIASKRPESRGRLKCDRYDITTLGGRECCGARTEVRSPQASQIADHRTATSWVANAISLSVSHHFMRWLALHLRIETSSATTQFTNFASKFRELL